MYCTYQNKSCTFKRFLREDVAFQLQPDLADTNTTVDISCKIYALEFLKKISKNIA